MSDFQARSDSICSPQRTRYIVACNKYIISQTAIRYKKDGILSKSVFFDANNRRLFACLFNCKSSALDVVLVRGNDNSTLPTSVWRNSVSKNYQGSNCPWMTKTGIPLLILPPCFKRHRTSLGYHIKPCPLVGCQLNAQIVFPHQLQSSQSKISCINTH